ncbi:MAG TPA: transcriptional regulator [Acidimicrobiales bacterium]|nr:transcriptional regulator [Acidimicrobiales bacterium]
MPQEREATDETLPFSREVGQRLRAVRRQRRLSLDDVERQSGGRWSASAIGAYERGFRNLSLPRLRELAEFYSVPMATLLGEIDLRDEASGRVAGGKVVLDLAKLEALEEAAPLVRYARSIVLERGDWNGRILSIRKDDVRALASMLHLEEHALLDQLQQWDVLVAPGTTIDLTTEVAAL